MHHYRMGAPLHYEIEPSLQWIEVSSSFQIPGFHIIGLPSPEVAEARERVRSAIESSGFEFPRRRVVLNLSPASIKKQGTSLDLAMALSVLFSEQVPPASEARTEPPALWVACGELGLDGRVKSSGQLTRTLYASWKAGAKILIVPRDDEAALREAFHSVREGTRSEGTRRDGGGREGTEWRNPPQIYPVAHLKEAWEILSGEAGAPKPAFFPKESPPLFTDDDSGGLLPLTPSLERTLGVSAAGKHHLLLLGPKGAGKSHALEWLIRIQPPLDPCDQLQGKLLQELSSAASLQTSTKLPVRRVSPQARPQALIGTSSMTTLRPGEFSLAHGGLLIADEFPEWSRDAREALREPLERGKVLLTRVRGSHELPARFTLAANGNFCPCGGWPREVPLPPDADPSASFCQCTERARQLYLTRLSGPLLDRIDLLVRVHYSPARGRRTGAGRVAALREQTTRARGEMLRRYGTPCGELEGPVLEELLGAHPVWQDWLELQAPSSLRNRHKLLRVALSLAAWDELEEPSREHFLEAACYRAERFGI